MQPSPKDYFDSPSTAIVNEWPEHMDAKSWDQRYPGVLDLINTIAGPANVIMQLSWPQVGYGVKESRVESGSVIKHPIKRTRTTLTYLAVAMTGTNEEKKAYRRAVNGAHAQVYSTEKSPVKYHAMDPQLQSWVAFCLYKGFIDAYSLLHGRPEIAQDIVFYRLAQPLGTTLQMRENMWPETIEGFEEAWQEGLTKANIDETLRTYLHNLTSLRYLSPITHFLFGRFNVFITTGFLPPELRKQMRYEWSEKDQIRFERVLRWIGRFNRLLPRVIRQASYLGYMWDFRRRLKNKAPLI